ncbi:MAG: hypothetical protein BM555_02300 [Crocinitomix sp. MedPE-SWsnd]|nr:MAG: hypothetical protein BM555_02300 [Crocinitomix sp. MedPE-SWsnd]
MKLMDYNLDPFVKKRELLNLTVISELPINQQIPLPMKKVMGQIYLEFLSHSNESLRMVNFNWFIDKR